MKFTFRLYNLLIIIACSLVSISCINSEETIYNKSKVKVGDRLPSFSVIANDGTIFSNESIVGKPTFITFFYTPCIDCKMLLPVVDALYKEYADELHWIAISRSEGDADVAAYWQENGFSLPYSAQDNRNVYDLFAYSGVPRIYLANAEGIVIAMFDDSSLPDSLSLETLLLSILN